MEQAIAIIKQDNLVRPKRSTYRRRSLEEKRRIVEETLLAGSSVSVVARRYDVNANQVFAWRQQYRRGKLGSQCLPGFVPITIIDGKDTGSKEHLPLPVATNKKIIELGLRGMRVRIEGDVQVPVLTCVLKTMRSLA